MSTCSIGGTDYNWRELIYCVGKKITCFPDSLAGFEDWLQREQLPVQRLIPLLVYVTQKKPAFVSSVIRRLLALDLEYAEISKLQAQYRFQMRRTVL